MNHIQLDCFVNIVRLGSIESAARTLFLSPQAVWKYTSNLEKELGVDLFKKGSHNLTKAGFHYYYIFEENYREFSIMKERIRLHYEQLSRSFSIGFSEWLDPLGKLDDVRSAFRIQHPQTYISTQKLPNGELFDALSSHKIDVAFISSQHLNQDKNLCVIEVDKESLCYYISADGARFIDKKKAQTCFDLPFLWSSPWPVSWLEQRQLQQQDFRMLDISPKDIMVLKNLQSICAELEFSECCIIAGSKYSVCKKIPGIQTFPIHAEVKTCCVFDPANENPLIPIFTKIAKQILTKN